MWIYEQTKPEENLSLLPQTVSLPVQKAEPALPTVPETAPEPVEQLPSKEPCPGLLAAGCGLSAGEFGSRCIAGRMRCPAGRAAAVLSGSVARDVCTGQYARDGTAF